MLEKYLETLDRSPNTKATYRIAIRQFLDVTGGELSEAAYKKYLLSLRGYLSPTKRVKAAAVKDYLDFMDAFTPAMGKLNKRSISKATTEPVIIQRDKIERVIAYYESLRGGLAELRDRAFVLTLADSGLRISELCGLRRGDIDWQDERVPVKGKRGKLSLVRLSRRSISALREYLSARQKLDGGTGKPLNTLPLFAQHGNTKKLKKMTVDGMRKSVKLRMPQAGVDPKSIRMHDFRHYFVTMIVVSTGDLKLAKDLARHESTTTTNRYAHYGDTEIDAKYEEIFNK